MSLDLSSLIELERLDREIAKLENSKMEFPKRVTEMEAELLEKQGAVKVLQDRLEAIEADINKLNNKQEENNQALSTSNERISLVKNNKEYDAVLLEISERKAMISKIASQLDKKNSAKQEIVAQLEEAEKEFNALKEELQPQIDELKEKINSIDDDIAKVENEKKSVLPNVPKNFLEDYNAILAKRKNGRVLSVITNSSSACSFCYQILNARVKKEAKISNSPVLCENCGSIVVWQEEPETEEA